MQFAVCYLGVGINIFTPKFFTMYHPLENYRVIGTANFFKNVDRDFWSIKYNELKENADGIEIYKELGTIEVFIVNHYAAENEDIGNTYKITLSEYCEEIYDELEKEAQQRIDEITMSKPDMVDSFAKAIIKELNAVIVSIATLEENNKYELSKSIINKKAKLFLARLELSFLKHTPLAIQNKIQWLGKTNLLTTLIYDLWQGQDKGSKVPSTKPLIKATKKDIENLLINNFIDEKGKPLTISTISDYLNTSKPETRAKIGKRIELDY